MKDGDKKIWQEVVNGVLKENTPWDSKNQSERYHVVIDSIKMPPKIVLARAIDIIRKEHSKIKIKKIGGGIPTNQFIEELGFQVIEDLVYNTSDDKKLRSHIEKRIHYRELFQDFINFGSSVLTDLEIEVYKVRMAIESKGILSIIVGMRAVYSYEEEEGAAIIGLLVSKNFKNENQDKFDFISAYDFKGEPLQQLVKVRVNDWSEMSQALLDEFKAQFELQYNQIKNSKLTQWNVEANTTNNALKYVLFNNENLATFMANENIVYNKPFFTEEEFDVLNESAGLPYNKEYEGMREAYATLKTAYEKVEYWAQLVCKELFSGGEVKVRKRPTNQANFFDSYLWAKIYPEKITKSNKWLAYTLSIEKDNGFTIKFDTINLPENTLKRREYLKLVDNYKNKTYIGISSKPDNWNDLIKKTIEFIDGLKPEFQKFMLQFDNMFDKESFSSKPHGALNQILYGPPGTGKTYQTISQSISIVDSAFFNKNQDNRDLLVERFKELTITNWSDTKGQIAFCTFHQSFTYEDFVEGIKPKVIDDKDIIYEVQKGVFKSLCDRARTATNDSSDFDSTINSLQNDILEEGPVTLATNRGNKFDVNYTGQTTFRIKPHESTAENPQYPASIENIRALYEGAPLTDLYNPSYVKGILEYLYKRYDLPKYQEVKNNDKPYVIIIDEINRGNVASIFGELITLIEPNKRSGAIEELSVILPYSKKEFTVPNNVHIIGTMNTADRSVEALDTALRRRFSFREIMPDYSVIEKELGAENFWNNSSVSEILKKINKRITHLIDRDHQIGHSYFLKLKEVPATEFSATIAAIFSENIIPLLQEYFFNDFSKIGMVIGEGFLNNIEWGANDFAKFDEGNSEDYEDNLFEIIDPKSMKTDQFEEAIKSLLN